MSYFDRVAKAGNPYHGEGGKFSSKDKDTDGVPSGGKGSSSGTMSHGTIHSDIQSRATDTYSSKATASKERSASVSILTSNGYSKSPKEKAVAYNKNMGVASNHDVYSRTDSIGTTSTHTISPVQSFENGGYGFDHSSSTNRAQR